MFCKECGNEVDNQARFCPKCGSSTSSKEKSIKVDTTKPIFTVRPVFIPWVAIASIIPIQIFGTIWASLFLGGFGKLLINGLGFNLSMKSTSIFFGALFFFGIPFLTYFARKNTYSQTIYKFFSDRLEYMEGFWTSEKKVIKYKNITEVNLCNGVIQKHYNLGTIILSTPATGSNNGKAGSGIKVLDINYPNKVYKKVLELIG